MRKGDPAIGLTERLAGLQYLAHMGLEDTEDYRSERILLEIDLGRDTGPHWAVHLEKELDRHDYQAAGEVIEAATSSEPDGEPIMNYLR